MLVRPDSSSRSARSSYFAHSHSNITAAGAVDREFFYIFLDSFWIFLIFGPKLVSTARSWVQLLPHKVSAHHLLRRPIPGTGTFPDFQKSICTVTASSKMVFWLRLRASSLHLLMQLSRGHGPI